MNQQHRCLSLFLISLLLAAAADISVNSSQGGRKLPSNNVQTKLAAAEAKSSSSVANVETMMPANAASVRNDRRSQYQMFQGINNNNNYDEPNNNEEGINYMSQKDIAERTRMELDALLSKRESIDRAAQSLDQLKVVRNNQVGVPRNQSESIDTNNDDEKETIQNQPVDNDIIETQQQIGGKQSKRLDSGEIKSSIRISQPISKQETNISSKIESASDMMDNQNIQQTSHTSSNEPDDGEPMSKGEAMSESISSANKLQQDEQSLPMVKQPPQPQQRQSGKIQHVSSRREKMQQELAEARRNPKKSISVAKEMPIPIINEEEEVIDIQQQQQDFVQPGLRGGDTQGAVVEPPQMEEATDTIGEASIREEAEENQSELVQSQQTGEISPSSDEVKDSEDEVSQPEQMGEVMNPITEQMEDVEEAQSVDTQPLLENEIESETETLSNSSPEENDIQAPLSPQQPPQDQSPKSLPLASSMQLEKLPAAVKNTMLEMEKKDVQEGKEIGTHYKELLEQRKREADMRKQNLSVVNSNPGNIVRPPPQAFRIDDPDSAQRFSQFIDRHKKSLIRKEKMRHPIQSIVGSGGSRGTVQTKESSPMRNYKAQMDKDLTANANKKMPDLRPEAQPKKRVGQKILRNIPVVKRVFKRTHAFETLNDASLSFTRGLLMGVFNKSNNALDSKKKTALLNWLDLLSVSLPPEIGLHELIDTMKNNIDFIAQSPNNLKGIVDKHPIPDNEYSMSCTKGNVGTQGFFCGFWKLLHIASVGFAEQEGGLMLRELHPNIRVFSPKEAGSVLREYMGLFFNCEKCSKRFIAQYDECKFDRCNRLTDKIDSATVDDWIEFPLWLWEVHNDVSRSNAERAADFHEKASRKAEAKKWKRYMGAVYPHLDQCLSCWTSAGTWDVKAVYKHLEREYWTFGVEVESKMQSLLDHKEASANSVTDGLGAYLGLGFVVLLTFILKKYKIHASGRHKKYDGNRFPTTSRDGRIKYRDS